MREEISQLFLAIYLSRILFKIALDCTTYAFEKKKKTMQSIKRLNEEITEVNNCGDAESEISFQDFSNSLCLIFGRNIF